MKKSYDLTIYALCATILFVFGQITQAEEVGGCNFGISESYYWDYYGGMTPSVKLAIKPQNPIVQMNLNWSEKDLLRAGRALSVGSTVVNPLQNIVPPPQVPLDLSQNTRGLTIDTSQINTQILQDNAILKGFDKTLNLGVKLAIPKVPDATKAGAIVGGAQMLLEFGGKMWDAYKVGTGRADPHILQSSIPHVVMAWDAIKGPENLPTLNFTPVISSDDDGAWKIKTQGYQISQQNFFTTAPGHIGKFGFDPYTDSIPRQTTTHTFTQTEFNGSQFNKTYQNLIPQTPIISPTGPIYNPAKIYTSPPIYTQPPGYTPPAYTPPPVYIPPTNFKWR